MTDSTSVLSERSCKRDKTSVLCHLGVVSYLTHTAAQIKKSYHHSTTFSPCLSLLCGIKSQVLTPPSLPDSISVRTAQPLPSLVNVKLISSRNTSRPLLPLVSHPFQPYLPANMLPSTADLPCYLAPLMFYFFVEPFWQRSVLTLQEVFAQIYYQGTISLSLSSFYCCPHHNLLWIRARAKYL